MKKKQLSRRHFMKQSLLASAAITIIPRFVLGGKGYTAPSDKITLGFIGTGKQGRILLGGFGRKAQVLAAADVDSLKLSLFKTNAEKLYAGATGQPDWKGIT